VIKKNIYLFYYGCWRSRRTKKFFYYTWSNGKYFVKYIACDKCIIC